MQAHNDHHHHKLISEPQTLRRRTIYLTIMSALDFEEAGHKLMKIQVDPGREIEVVTMILECCSQEKTYIRCASFIGLPDCIFT